MHTNQIARRHPRWPFSQAERRGIIKLFLTRLFMLQKLRLFKAKINMFSS